MGVRKANPTDHLLSNNHSFQHPSFLREGGLSEKSERSDELKKAITESPRNQNDRMGCKKKYSTSHTSDVNKVLSEFLRQ